MDPRQVLGEDEAPPRERLIRGHGNVPGAGSEPATGAAEGPPLSAILDLDPATLPRILGSQVFWLILVLALMPLLMAAAGLPTEDGLILYFAFLWFLLFLRVFRLSMRGTLAWDYLLVVSLTVVPGIVLLLPALRVLLGAFYGLLGAPDLRTRAVAYLLGVGPAEEITKLVPVLLVVALVRRVGRRPGLQASILLGIAAGLAFAGFENILYSDWFGAKLWGQSFTRQDVVLSRLLMTPFLHSLWAGLTGFAVGVASESGPLQPRRLLPIVLPALVLAAVLHASYDILAVMPALAVVAGAVSYFVLVVAIAIAKQWEGGSTGFLLERVF
jgi:RsiW-degrading membrane proteinase PrsW (M82 family)